MRPNISKALPSLKLCHLTKQLSNVKCLSSYHMWGFIHVWCLALLSCSWHHQWAKQMLDCFLCLSNNTYFIAMYSALKLFSSLSALLPVWRRWLYCHTGLESVSTPACPLICSNARPGPLLILPCTDSITHSYSLTEEACSQNAAGQMVWRS